VWRKRQELQQNKCEKLQLGEHWVLEFFHISSSIMLAYMPLSWGWCFFWGEIFPFLDKEIGNYY